MKKFFLYLVLLILILIFGSSFFADYYIASNEVDFLVVANGLKYSCMVALIAGIIAWILGIVIGLLVGFKKLKAAVAFILDMLEMVPWFLVSALIILVFGNAFETIILSVMLPAFIMVLKVSIESILYLKDKNYRTFIKGDYYKKYVAPVYIKPLFLALLNSIRLVLYLDLGLGILGVMPSYTLGGVVYKYINETPSLMAIAVSILLLILTNTASLLAPWGRGRRIV